ncbi:EndoU domain-containing protein [uncultured Corynebacterium sp.]|uniref:VG15 protein n=1 Tax=uncultured Corynebacterium sp. TaxID=159447 RepID=UPI00259A033E|nr:EndoU domain-containing protein [uncultured Corynebacterium sp.]
MDYLQIRRDYAGTLDGLEKLALQDFAAWWDATEGTPFFRRRELLEEPFTAIAQAYGEQAAHAAADYLFLQRGLDETLAGLAYPDVAAPVEYQEAVAAYRAASRVSQADWKRFIADGATDDVDVFHDKTFQKLSGALNRVVLRPARQTIASNIADGMKFARVPNPGACNWCLMLASRGAVYSKDSVGMTRATRFHDHCRCIGMEVSDSAPLPSVNRELEAAWQEATTNSVDQAEMHRDWKNHLDRRSKVLQSKVVFPSISGVEIPKYRGEPVRTVTLPSGETLDVPLPSLHQVPGHVLYGWTTAPPWGRKRQRVRHRRPGDYSLDNRFGHRAGSTLAGTKFPADWSDQQIVNAVRDTLEQGEVNVTRSKPGLFRDRDKNEWHPMYDYSVSAEFTNRGQKVRALFDIIDGVPVQARAYPLKG